MMTTRRVSFYLSFSVFSLFSCFFFSLVFVLLAFPDVAKTKRFHFKIKRIYTEAHITKEG